jgi:hypothetical protein
MPVRTVYGVRSTARIFLFAMMGFSSRCVLLLPASHSISVLLQVLLSLSSRVVG